MMKKKGGQKMVLNPALNGEDVPDDWVCPDCGATKEDFEMEQF